MIPRTTVFEFTSYQFEPQKKRVVFHYKTEFLGRAPILWIETIILPSPPAHEPPQKLLEALHIVLGISYYKFYCATNIQLPYTLSKQETDFWNTVYKKGLGEFFYKNNLDPKISPKFPFSKSAKIIPCTIEKTDRSLVGIGGGKDSIVSAELLKAGKFDFTSFHVETGRPSDLVDNVIKTIGGPQLKVQRFLDWQVRQPHRYNGHIPISAIYAFLGIFAGTLYGYDSFIVSNEHSSNFGNITYKGLEINHQWSKSFEFETLFSDYVKHVISPDVKYFSLMRSLYEIRIVKLFTKYPQYFPLFSSCNQNFTTKGNERGKLWCGQCAKCVFVFTLLSAFLTKKKLLDIFSKNLYQNEALLPLFKDILGLSTMKPFDCVGTFKEAQTALFLAKNKFGGDSIVQHLGAKAQYHKEVFKTAKENAVPEAFKFLGMETVQIVRHEGIEGQSTKKFLKKFYPKLKITKEHADITIKTPGIDKSQITGLYSTPTNIFFSVTRRRASGNFIIGITGSKGKSTTSSLIYHILKTAGKNTVLLGNIGKPMLEYVLRPVKKDTIFVLELSSFQLDDIKFSPEIAVVTNLFPEHMDFHGSLKSYYEAKKNIINFQTSENYFVYNQKSASWLKNYQGKPVKFSPKKYKSNLIGSHNQSNVGAAVAAAKILKIPQAQIKKAVKSFKALPHRLENVGTFKGITFYDDAISTTPESTIMAIRALKYVDTIFLGGQDRGYNFTGLEKAINQYKIKNIVLFPDSGSKMLKSTKGLNVLKTKKMAEAVKFAYKNTAPGKICLLSCASPSYSLWKNFEVKGDEFKRFVKRYA